MSQKEARAAQEAARARQPWVPRPATIAALWALPAIGALVAGLGAVMLSSGDDGSDRLEAARAGLASSKTARDQAHDELSAARLDLLSKATGVDQVRVADESAPDFAGPGTDAASLLEVTPQQRLYAAVMTDGSGVLLYTVEGDDGDTTASLIPVTKDVPLQ